MALAAKIFNSKEFQEDFFTIPCVITDVFLGTLLWAQSPASIVEFNKKRLISCAASSIEPNKHLRNKLIQQTQKLLANGEINDDQGVILLESQISRDLLSEITLGDPNRFTDRTPFEILEQYAEEIRSEERIRHIDTIGSLHSKIDILEKTTNSTIVKENGQKRIARKVSSFISWAIFALFFIFLGISLFLATGLIPINPFWKTFFIITTFLISFVEVVYGTNIFNIKLKIKKKIEKIIKVKIFLLVND